MFSMNHAKLYAITILILNGLLGPASGMFFILSLLITFKIVSHFAFTLYFKYIFTFLVSCLGQNLEMPIK